MTRTGWLFVGITGITIAAVARKYLTPGVVVEEVPEPPRPMEGVGTSTAAFVDLDPDSDPGTDPERL
jgi:hypothetical protein